MEAVIFHKTKNSYFLLKGIDIISLIETYFLKSLKIIKKKVTMCNLLNQSEIEKIIENLSHTGIIRDAYMQLPTLGLNQNYIQNEVFLDCEDGKIFNHIGFGRDSFIDRHIIKIYSINSDTINNLSSEDLSGDDMLPESGDCKDYSDYDERVVECLFYYCDYSLDMESIRKQLNKIYE